MNGHIEETPESRWRHLREGLNFSVTIETDEKKNETPQWFDKLKFYRAKEIVLKYRVGVQFSSLTGLFLVLQLPDGLEPLLSTGKSKDIPSLFKRYSDTTLHVEKWYNDDVFNPETEGYKSIRQVRAMHKRLQTSMNDKFKTLDLDNKKARIWFNQYDVALTQFSFIGVAMIYPEKSGMIAASPEELELINYYWRVLGYLMGVKDEFNLCHFERYEHIKKYNELVLEHEFLAKFSKMPCKKGLEMCKAICTAMHDLIPLVTFNFLAHWWKDCFQFNDYQPQRLSMHEKVLYMTTKFSFGCVLKHERSMNFATKIHLKRLYMRAKDKDAIYKKLKKKYPSGVEPTFYSDRCNYFGEKKSDNSDKNKTLKEDLEQPSCPFAHTALA